MAFLTEYIAAIGLPSVDVEVGDIVTATGWGKASDNAETINNVRKTFVESFKVFQ